MADETKQVVQEYIPNIGTPRWVSSLAAALNKTYSYSNSTLFVANINSYYKDYAFRYILPCVQWLDGFVPELHNNGTGIISTRIASCLISGLAKHTAGEKIIFIPTDKATPEVFKILKQVNEWALKQKIHKAIKNAIGYAYGVGTSAIKLNVKNGDTVWWQAVRFDNFYVLASANNEVKDISFFMRSYTDTRDGKDNCQYFLYERRYYKWFDGKIQKNPDGTYKTIETKGYKPVTEYKIHRATSQSLNNMMPSANARSSVNWDEIPVEIRKLIKSDYSVIRINEPQLLPFPNLGVELFVNGEGDISIPTGDNFGESMIIKALDDFITYEIASSYLLRDMNNGKGTVYLPKSMSMGDIMGGQLPPLSSPNSGTPDHVLSVSEENANAAPMGIPPMSTIDNPWDGVGNTPIERLKGVSPEDQQAIVQQFDIRADEWQHIKENSIKNIAVKWGMSPKILASFLIQGQAQMTATQIDSEDDSSIAFINLHRTYFINEINNLLETTLNFMGIPNNVKCKFASPSLLNKDRLLQRILQELQAGLITMEDAIRELNPDDDEETLQSKIQKAVESQQNLLLQSMNQMNELGGGFGGDSLLKGSTVPRA